MSRVHHDGQSLHGSQMGAAPGRIGSIGGLSGTAAYGDPPAEFVLCIKECSDCAALCARCAHHCLHMGGDHAAAHHQGIMRDCAEICALACAFLARCSPHAVHVCRECAEICTACAVDCERLAETDAMMMQCARVCRQCAQACERMSGVAA